MYDKVKKKTMSMQTLHNKRHSPEFLAGILKQLFSKIEGVAKFFSSQCSTFFSEITELKAKNLNVALWDIEQISCEQMLKIQKAMLQVLETLNSKFYSIPQKSDISKNSSLENMPVQKASVHQSSSELSEYPQATEKKKVVNLMVNHFSSLSSNFTEPKDVSLAQQKSFNWSSMVPFNQEANNNPEEFDMTFQRDQKGDKSIHTVVESINSEASSASFDGKSKYFSNHDEHGINELLNSEKTSIQNFKGRSLTFQIDRDISVGEIEANHSDLDQIGDLGSNLVRGLAEIT